MTEEMITIKLARRQAENIAGWDRSSLGDAVREALAAQPSDLDPDLVGAIYRLGNGTLSEADAELLARQMMQNA